MYLETNNKYSCSGCTACKFLCPVDAIEMIRDEEGFKYPQINQDKCINCNKCVNVCPNVKKSSDNEIIEAYGVKHKNLTERTTSRSGGAFIAISDYILKNEGIVYGSKLNEDFSVSHNRATNKEERDLFKGSKYVQSSMNDIIDQVKKDLENNKQVLFTGTPCQVAGIAAAIPNKLKNNLYLCDLLCHAVPSPMIYEEYLKFIEEKFNKKIKKFIFRDKSFGWSTNYETIIFEDGSKETCGYFRDLFFRHNTVRPSCYNCNYANTNRIGDLTIGDFWGVDELNPEFYDEIGVSLIMINNQKGKEIFENIKSDIDVVECTIDNCIKYSCTLSGSCEEPKTRKEFWNDYMSHDFKFIIDKYAQPK